MKKLTVTLLCIVAGLAQATVETKEFSGQNLNQLKVKSRSGDVRISVSKDGKAYVSATKVKFEKSCTININRVDSKLIVEVDSDGGLFNSSECKVNFDIQVPQKIALVLKSGSGNLITQGTNGEIDVKLGSGNAKLSGEISRLSAKAGSGTINASGLTGNANVKTGSGNMSLSYSKAPLRAKLGIKTGSGNAIVVLPATAKIMTKFKAGSGQIYNELGDSRNADFRVSMKAGSGNLEIKKQTSL